MKAFLRALTGVLSGIATALIAVVAIENSAWWLSGHTETFADPLINGMRFAASLCAGLAVALFVNLRAKEPADRAQYPVRD